MSNRLLVAILVVAFALQVITVFASPNLYYPDEIFQTTEIGHRLAFGNGVMSWEWREGIRSYVYPFFLSLVMRATVWMGHGSAGYLAGVTVVMALLFLGVVWFCYRWAQHVAGRAAATIAGATAAVWFFLLFMGSKTFTETISADALLPGLVFSFGFGGFRAANGQQPDRRNLFLGGLLCAAAMALRPQLGPTVLFAGIWICWGDLRGRLPAFGAGFVASLAVFGLADAFTLGYPFASIVRYFWVNVAEGKSKLYGTQPWFFYLQMLFRTCWPLLPCAILGLRRSPFLGWLLLVLVGSHSVLAHKEFRFIYLAFPLIIALFGIGCVELAEWMRSRRWIGSVSDTALATAVVAGVVIFSGVQARLFGRWHNGGGLIRMADVLSHKTEACGLGIYAFAWSMSPGYTHVHLDVPMYLLHDPAQLSAEAGAFNELLAPKAAKIASGGFSEVQCSGDACLYERPGGCSRAEHRDVAAEMQAKHE